MRIRDFLKEKAGYLFCHLTVAAITVLMLTALNPAGGAQFSILIGILYLIGALIPLVVECRRKWKFYSELMRVFDGLDRKNLIAEVITAPDFWEGAILYDVLKASNKVCLEEINHYKNMQTEYREYIELWVHEIKTPISSSKLIAQNNRNAMTDSICEELDTIESYVEQALFYARSNTVERDYIIKEISLEKTVYSALKRDSGILIRRGVSLSVRELDYTVYSDAKWLEFILHQLLINSVKYAAETRVATITITARENENSCVLTISDNGMGIPEHELPRIFDKGFTGTNGRLRGKSTGMGLYICRKLCDKLGISISAQSMPDTGTTIDMVFPKSSMTSFL